MPAFSTKIGPQAEDLSRCVHCGLCLEACPTYSVLGLETESPRGRIQLARALSEDRIELTPSVVSHFDLCLGCRACETACPSGVPYGRIIESVRAQLHDAPVRPRSARLLGFVLRQALASPWRLSAFFRLARVYQRSRVAPILRRLMPRPLRQAEQLLPRLPNHFYSAPAVAAEPMRPVQATVALLRGCVMPYLTANTCEATQRVLTRNGRRVLVPKNQACCGAMLVHYGDREGARKLARRNVDTFMATNPDAIIVNAGGCGSTLKEYGELLADDPAYTAKAAVFATKVRDINEYLAEIDFEAPAGNLDMTVTYQDSCHVAHGQGIRQQPRRILRSIPGLRLVEMANSDRCCGSAGTYKLTQAAMSRRLLAEKLTAVAATGCSVIATSNPDCMLQLDMGLRLRAGEQEVVHVVELLDRSYQAEPASS